MFDALTIAAIVDELNREIVDGRIQRVQHIDELTLGLEVYARHSRRWLVLSANSQHPRALLLDDRGGGDPERVSPLLLLLRKFARGARILSITQPRYERIIEIAITIPDPDAPLDEDDESLPALVQHRLIVELMGRHSNIVLVDEEGLVREAIKRVTPQMSRVRPILPNHRYSPPPPQDKVDPLDAWPSDLDEIDASGPLWRGLIACYLAMSPLLAREVCARSGVDPRATTDEIGADERRRIVEAVREIFGILPTQQWQPRLYEFEDGGAEFSAIPLQSLESRADVETVETESVLGAAAQAAQRGPAQEQPADRHAARRQRLIASIDQAADRLDARMKSLQHEQQAASDPDALREAGDLIYAYQWMIEPGASKLETPEGRTITLDPTLSISDNAQQYFERYRKTQSAVETIPRRIAEVKSLQDYVDQLRTMAEQAESFDEIENLRAEWEEFIEETPGLVRSRGGRRRPKGSKRAVRLTTQAGHHIYIGRSGRQNEEVTFQIANSDDLWLHARDLPGAHVILRFNSPGGHEEAIEQAAALAAYYSKGRGSTRVSVDVTERRHVRKIKGAGPGMVTYRNERTLNIEPRSEREIELVPSGS